MHTFNDTEGRTWTFNLTIGAVKRVQALLDINLLEPLGTGRKRIRGKDRRRKKPQPLVTRLQLDVILLVDVIFALLKPEADQRDVSDEQFAAALGGDAAYNAFEAFMDEWRDFFHRLRRETEAKAIQANMELVAAEDKRNVEMVDKVTEAAIAAAESERRQAIKRIETLGRSGTATGSPESSDSTPAPSTP